MRLFIAAEPGAELTEELLRIGRRFKASGVTGSYTPKENLHLTLAFIGEYNDTKKVMESIRLSSPEKSGLELSGIGSFGDLYYAAVNADGALYSYVERLKRNLKASGVPYDGKSFKPHITLIRRAENVGEIPEVFPVTGEVTRIVLMRSDRGPRGMIYTPIGSCGCKETV